MQSQHMSICVGSWAVALVAQTATFPPYNYSNSNTDSLGENALNKLQNNPSDAYKCGEYPNTPQSDWRLIDLQYMFINNSVTGTNVESYVFLTRHETYSQHYRVSVYTYQNSVWTPAYCFGTKHSSKIFNRLVVSSTPYSCAPTAVEHEPGPVACWSYALYNTESPGDMKVYHTYNLYDSNLWTDDKKHVRWPAYILTTSIVTLGESNCVHDSADHIVAVEVASTNSGILVETTAHNLSLIHI